MVRMLRLLCLLKMIILMFVVILSLHHGVEAEAMDLCPDSIIKLTRESEDTRPQNQHVWALGYYGNLYKTNDIIGTAIVTITRQNHIIWKWNITGGNNSKTVIEPTSLADEQSAPFQLSASQNIATLQTISVTEKLPKKAEGLHISWKFSDSECQFNISVKECSYAGGTHKPSVILFTEKSYLEKGKLNCSNSKLFNVKNGTVHEDGTEVTCLSDATWSHVDEYECWTKPTIELEGTFTVKENETLSLECKQTGGYPKVNESTSVFVIDGTNVMGTTNVTYKDDKKTVYCQAHSNYTKFSNEAMVKSNEKVLNVEYAPRGNETQNCTLRNDRTCYVDFRSNPKADNCSWITVKNGTSINIKTEVESKSGENRDHQCKLTFSGVEDKHITLTEVKVAVTSTEFPNHPLIVRLRIMIVPISIETTTTNVDTTTSNNGGNSTIVPISIETTTTNVDTTTPNNGGNSTPPPDPNISSPILGIAIGGAALFIAVIIIVVCWVLKKRKKKTSTEAPEEVNNELYGESNFNKRDGAVETTNVLYGQVAGTQPSGEKINPLYDTASSARTGDETNNPLYDTASAAHTSEEKTNPLYDTATSVKGGATTGKKKKKTKARPAEEKNNPLYDTASAAHTSEERTNPLYDTATAVKGGATTDKKKKKKKTKALTLEEKNNPLYGTISEALPTSEERNNPLYDTASKVTTPTQSDDTYAVITKKQKKAAKPAQTDDTYAEVNKKQKKVTTPAQSDDTYAVITRKQKKVPNPAPSDDTYAVVTKKQKQAVTAPPADDTYAVVTKKPKKAVTPPLADDTYAVVTKKPKKAVIPPLADDTYAVVTKKPKKESLTSIPIDDTYAEVQKSAKKNKPEQMD